MIPQDAIRIASENVEAYNAGNWERLKAALAPDVTYDELGGQRKLQGANAFANAYQGWKEAGPDGTGTITNAVAVGDTVLLEVTWTATNTGRFGSNPPTGKKWNVRGAQVVILEGNKIKELRQYFDMNTIVQQLT
ncbi:MAG TPA: ester cyclase [Rhodanobacteraceae bacterium]|nr:ester cyclase [Rhodanobacteraceae bacterium]